jgi:hypothetical protein
MRSALAVSEPTRAVQPSLTTSASLLLNRSLFRPCRSALLKASHINLLIGRVLQLDHRQRQTVEERHDQVAEAAWCL